MLMKATAASTPTAGRDARDRLAAGGLFRDLLVHQDAGAASSNALGYARSLMDDAGGKVTALMLGLTPIYPAGFYGEATADAWLAARAQAEKEAAELERMLRARLEKAAPEAEFRRMDVLGGDGPDRFAEIARYFAAAVLGMDSPGGTDAQRRLFNAALFQSGRPLLVIPAAAEMRGAPRRIAVGWSPTREATRAIHDALPLLMAAELVMVVAVDDPRARSESGEPGADIAAHLARHGVEAEVRFVPKGEGGVTGTLVDEARYCGAELMVLGGYGHTRFSEWLLGGVSRDIVAASPIPLLFSH
jgi:nucleotide-binding universal stress UspA family protein